jgi:hypothetical protein
VANKNRGFVKHTNIIFFSLFGPLKIHLMESDFVSNLQGAIVEQLFWSIRFIPYTWWVLSIFFFPKSVTFFTVLPWTLMAFIIVKEWGQVSG